MFCSRHIRFSPVCRHPTARRPISVATFLLKRFPDAPLVLPPRAYADPIAAAAVEGVAGGAIYDALIAATVRHAGATLLTRDQRARRVYERMKVSHELVV